MTYGTRFGCSSREGLLGKMAARLDSIALGADFS